MEEHIYKKINSKNGSPRYTFLTASVSLLNDLNNQVTEIRRRPSNKPYSIDYRAVSQMYSHELGDIDENALILSYVYHNYHKKKKDMVSMEAYYLELREFFLDLKIKEEPPFCKPSE